jgi:hypothetical protein
MGTVPARSVRLIKTGVTNISRRNLNAASLCGLSPFLPFNIFASVTSYTGKNKKVARKEESWPQKNFNLYYIVVKALINRRLT